MKLYRELEPHEVPQGTDEYLNGDERRVVRPVTYMELTEVSLKPSPSLSVATTKPGKAPPPSQPTDEEWAERIATASEPQPDDTKRLEVEALRWLISQRYLVPETDNKQFALVLSLLLRLDTAMKRGKK